MQSHICDDKILKKKTKRKKQKLKQKKEKEKETKASGVQKASSDVGVICNLTNLSREVAFLKLERKLEKIRYCNFKKSRVENLDISINYSKKVQETSKIKENITKLKDFMSRFATLQII